MKTQNRDRPKKRKNFSLTKLHKLALERIFLLELKAKYAGKGFT